MTDDSLSLRVAQLRGCFWKEHGYNCPARRKCPGYRHDAGWRNGVLWPVHNFLTNAAAFELLAEAAEGGFSFFVENGVLLFRRDGVHFVERKLNPKAVAELWLAWKERKT